MVKDRDKDYGINVASNYWNTTGNVIKTEEWNPIFLCCSENSEKCCFPSLHSQASLSKATKLKSVEL